MNLIKFHRQLTRIKKCYRSLSTLPSAEYTDYPEYPPIEELSRESKNKKKIKNWCDAVKAVKTVEEKQMKLNMPKYYGWKSLMFNDDLFPYNCMSLVQHCTRTHFKESALPSYYNNLNVDQYIQEIQSLIEEALLFEQDVLKNHDVYAKDLTPFQRENVLSDSIIKQINRIILNNLSSLPHLADAQIDFEPRHEAFWFVGGINPPELIRKARANSEWFKDIADEPIDRAVQYIGVPSLTLRAEQLLEPVISMSEAENPSFDVPLFTYDPKVIGYNYAHRHGTNIPGFWPGDKHEFGLLSFQRRGHMLNRSKSFGEADDQEALHSHGILSSFAWLLSQASYQGFTTYNDITYPLVAQTIITNGQLWSFYVYQLNTTVFHSHHIHSNPKKNICWGTKTQKLYEEIKDGKVIGFNREVLKDILKLYVNVPKERLDVDMKPYLAKDERVIAEINDDEKRDWLEKQYKHMMSNRPRHLPKFELYHWEKIYKIDHKTRITEGKHRPFELGVNPWKRKYDERSPSYIPKALRPGGPKDKNKFYKSYYP